MKTKLVTVTLLFLIASLLAACQSPFRTYPDEIWPQRVGVYNYSQAVSELGPPNNKETFPDNSGFSASWTTYRADSGSSTIVLNFDNEQVLKSWNQVRHH